MRNFILSSIIALALTAVSPAGAYAETFSADFNSGSLPKSISIEEGDNFKLHENCYRSVYPMDAWTLINLGTNGYAIVSLTHGDTGNRQNNIMTLPELKIDENNPVLRWRGISYHPDFKDSYKVEIKTEGSSGFTTLFSTDAEESTWQTRVVSLDKYAGKSVTIRFVCNSTDGFMLAVDDIFVGPAEEQVFFAVDTTRKFVGQEDYASVSGTVTNAGMPLSDARILLLDADGKTVDSKSVAGVFAIGQTVSYDLLLPVKLNEKSSYSVAVEANGEKTVIDSAIVFSSYFPRNLVLEKCTGMWCTNCPEGTIQAEKFCAPYGDQVFLMENHVSNNGIGDVLANNDYWANLKFYNVPYFMLNRVRDTAFSSTKNMAKGLYKETPAMLEFTKEMDVKDASGFVTLNIVFAKDLDNSDDRYRIGYSLQKGFFEPEMVDDFRQTNGSTTAAAERYKYLPSKIPAHLLHYDHVTLTSEYDFAGLANSISADIKANQPMTCKVDLSCPDLSESLKDCHMIAYILDTETGEMLNAARLDLNEKPENVEVDEIDGFCVNITVNSGKGFIRIAGATDATVELFSLSGVRIGTAVTGADGSATIMTDGFSGIAIVRIKSENGSKTFKAIVR